MKPSPCNHVVTRIPGSSFSASEIIYYTGKDPLKELEPIARHVTGVCANETGFTESNKGNEGRSSGELEHDHSPRITRYVLR